MTKHFKIRKPATSDEEVEEIDDARKMAGLSKINSRYRDCLKCSKRFFSKGNWNRLCDNCRRSAKNDCGIPMY